MIWNDLDDNDNRNIRFRVLPKSSSAEEKNPVPELKDELYDLWELSYWKQRQWTEVSPFLTHASAE